MVHDALHAVQAMQSGLCVYAIWAMQSRASWFLHRRYVIQAMQPTMQCMPSFGYSGLVVVELGESLLVSPDGAWANHIKLCSSISSRSYVCTHTYTNIHRRAHTNTHKIAYRASYSLYVRTLHPVWICMICAISCILHNIANIIGRLMFYPYCDLDVQPYGFTCRNRRQYL